MNVIYDFVVLGNESGSIELAYSVTDNRYEAVIRNDVTVEERTEFNTVLDFMGLLPYEADRYSDDAALVRYVRPGAGEVVDGEVA